MNHNEIERKWQGIWNDTGINTFDESAGGDKHYVLEMLPYPSGAKLHMGHWYNYGIADSYARFMRMNGKNVFQPMGFDAFGLPAENYAIKTGVHPKDSTDVNIATMERQLKDMGTMVDWGHEFRTCAPDYYMWTQWLFLQLYKNGLAYQKKAPVNFCPSCQTVIANEQVVDGKCERCKTEVVHKEMTQWFLKITDYAEKLLSGIDALDWPEKTKTMQRNWIGKSVGGEVVFDLVEPKGDVKSITVFTTRADTLFGVTYVVLAPEHPYVNAIVTDGQRAQVEAYVALAAKQSEIERTSTSKDKTGVFTGAYCVNPINGEKVPVYVADYCLSTYGTGAVMGVAAHDTRDYAFALKNSMPIKRVIKGKDGNDELPFTEYGVMTNSGRFDGLPSDKGKTAVLEELAKIGCGGKKINYRMRDWSVSRQRYWGAPIPIIYCEHCGAVPVPEKDLPVTLPYNVNFTPDGKSPLARSEQFINTVCPVCGKPARRESDTLDTFVCSSWYYLRYPDAHNDSVPFDRKTVNKMLPVDCYVGGAEHACTHLLYSRFITKVLHDLGYLDFDEPFKRLVHQGVILGPDGYRMSKTRGNVISADPLIEKYGSDALRLYLMFGFDYTEGGPWSDNGITSCAKFMDRIERLVEEVKDENASVANGALDYELNYCIKEVTKDIPEFGFNTAVARLMELVNAMYKYVGNKASAEYNPAYLKHVLQVTVKLMAPLAPHFCEELNQMLGGKKSVFLEKYPTCDESKLVKSSVEYAVQINSKIRCKVVLPQGLDRDAIAKSALETAEVKEVLNGATPVKVIVIPERLINLIVK